MLSGEFLLLCLDHDQHHFECGDGIQSMGDIRRHDDAFPCFQMMRFAADRDSGFSIKNADHCIEWRGMFAEPLICVEGKERHRSPAVFDDGAAYDRSFRVGDLICRSEDLRLVLCRTI